MPGVEDMEPSKHYDFLDMDLENLAWDGFFKSFVIGSRVLSWHYGSRVGHKTFKNSVSGEITFADI